MGRARPDVLPTGGELADGYLRVLADLPAVKPNVLGASGIPAHGEKGTVLDGALPDVLGRDRDRFAGKRVVVVGAGHSAANTLLSLAELPDRP